MQNSCAAHGMRSERLAGLFLRHAPRASHGISLWFARYRRVQVAHAGAPLRGSFRVLRIARLPVPDGRAARRSNPLPPALGETTTAAASELCTASAPVAYSNLLRIRT